MLGLEKALTEEELSEGLPPGRDFTLKPSKAGTFESLNVKETPEERWERIQRDAKLSTHLSSAEAEAVKNILWERASCFSDQPGTYKGVESKIDTGNARPVASRGYRNPKLSDPAFRQQILEWEDIGIVEKSTSAWAAPVLVVPKKSGAFRTVIDFRGLNKLLAKEENPVPRVMDVLDTLGGAKYFTSLDLTSGYYQLSVREEDRHKTAFMAVQKGSAGNLECGAHLPEDDGTLATRASWDQLPLFSG